MRYATLLPSTLVAAASLAVAPGTGHAQDTTTPLAPLTQLVGRWGSPPDDPMLANRPDMRNMLAFDFEWGPRRWTVRMWEGLPDGDRERAVLEGLITWDPAEEKMVFIASNTRSNFLFKGEYSLDGAGRLQRVYDVFYPPGYERIPEPDLDGNVRRFREVFYPEGNEVRVLLTVWRDGQWKPWGPPGGEYRVVRVDG